MTVIVLQDITKLVLFAKLALTLVPNVIPPLYAHHVILMPIELLLLLNVFVLMDTLMMLLVVQYVIIIVPLVLELQEIVLAVAEITEKIIFQTVHVKLHTMTMELV
jgi:hypothetical protein